MPATTNAVDLQEWLRSAVVVIEAHPLPGDLPGSFERFILDHGRPYESRKLTKGERGIADAAIREHRSIHRKFERQRCFANSQALLGNDDTKTMIYVEGFAWTHALGPVLHGWVTINGKVVDVTLPPTNRREAKLAEPLQALGEFSGRSYFGVPFLRSYVGRRREVTGAVGSLLDDEEHEYPLLKNGPGGAVRRRH